LKNENLDAKLEKEKLASSIWKESSESGQITIDSLLAHQDAMNKAMMELEQTKTALRAQTNNSKRQLEELTKNDEQSKTWAKNEVPQNIQNLLSNAFSSVD